MPTGKMKAIVKTKPGPGAELNEITIPKPQKGEILVKVNVTSICGSDLHIYKWNSWAAQHVHPPQVMGHELAGKVVELGQDVTSVNVGDFVSAETHIPCQQCRRCRTGQMHICKQMKILGVDTNGSFAEYVVIPAVVAWKNHPSIPIEYASIQEPLGNAIDTVLSEHEGVSGMTVAITGAGPAGLFSVGIAKISGATEIFVTDVNEYRLSLAQKMGATHVLNPQKIDVVDYVLKATAGDGVDVVLELSGKAQALTQGLQMLTPGGRMSILGVFNEPVTIDLNNQIIFKNIRIYGITGRRMFSTWFKAANYLRSNVIDLSPVITHKFKLEEIEKGFELMNSGNCGKILILP